MQAALGNFTSSLQRVRDIADDIFTNAPLALANPAVQRRFETTQCAATVVLSGFFESFLREVGEAFIRELTAKNIAFASLPASIRFAHYIEGAQVLSRRGKDEKAGRASLVGASAGDLARRLGSVTTSPYELLWEAFVDTRANPGVETVTTFVKRLALNNVWERLADQTGISANTIRLTLDSFIKVRNECAHTGTTRTIPTPSEIIGYCDFFEEVGSTLVDILEVHLAIAPLTW